MSLLTDPASPAMLQDIVQKMQDILDANKTFEDFRDVFVGICTVAIDVTFEKGHLMCPGLVDAYGPVVSRDSW